MSKARVDEAFGIIPLRKQTEGWQMLLVRHHGGHWGFPKGHALAGETFQQTAERELMEETRLEVIRYLLPDVFQEKYQFEERGQQVYKTVHYLVAEVEGEATPQPEEIQTAQWFSCAEAQAVLTFPHSRSLCQKVISNLEVSNV